MAVDKVFYNQSSEVKLGWEPDWWGCEHNDEELVEAVRKWQRRIGITADGLVGPTTYRRIWTEREADIHDYAPPPSRQCGVGQKFIVHNSKFLPIEWDKVVLWDEEGGLKCDKGNYYDYSGKPDRKPSHFTNHWDVCLSTETMAKVINRRGVSMHFGIDNDGTIYQLMDTQNGAWQAGHWYGNKHGIGVEISNAYYPKYQGWYEKNGFGPRPLVEGATVHGKTLGDHLGFYPVQLEALKKLWKALHLGIGIPLEYPAESNGNLCKTVHSDVTGGRFEGFCNHYNYTRNKIDCAELDLVKLLKEVKDEL
jgi:hypothetical protein